MLFVVRGSSTDIIMMFVEVSETITPCEALCVWEVKNSLFATVDTQRALASRDWVTMSLSKKMHAAVCSLNITFRWFASTAKSTLDACACSSC